MPFRILSIGTATPPNRIRQADAAEASRSFSCRNEREARLHSMIFNKSEVRTRSSVVLEPPNGLPLRQSFYPPLRGEDDRGPTTLDRMQRYEETAPQLAITATRDALARSHLNAREFTHLITVTCTGFFAPGIDIALITALDLPPTIQRVQVGFMGCHALINAVRVAQAVAAAEPHAKIMICAVELCSLHFYYGWDVDKVKANALFADGAAVLIGSAEPGDWQVAATGSCLLPDSEEDMTWRIGNHGFEMTLSARLPEAIGEHLRPWLTQWLNENNLEVAQIGSWAIHPGGPKIVSTVGECLNLCDSATAESRLVLAEYGNMSSPTLGFILDRLRRSNAPRPCLALGFGPGVVAEAALFV